MTRIRMIALVASTLVVYLPGRPANAQPVLWPSASGGNDHYYEFIQVPNPFSGNNNAWSTAKAAADASVFNNVHGYLATITSQGENDFVFGLVAGLFTTSSGAWLGGKHPEGWLDGPETGQAFTFTNWGGGEPNNIGQVYMNVGPVFAGVSPGRWLDDSGPGGPGDGLPDPNLDPVIGYFVEYPSVVPEPSSWFLVTSGLAMMTVLRRRKASPGVGQSREDSRRL